jgi:hypothetical protein
MGKIILRTDGADSFASSRSSCPWMPPGGWPKPPHRIHVFAAIVRKRRRFDVPFCIPPAVYPEEYLFLDDLAGIVERTLGKLIDNQSSSSSKMDPVAHNTKGSSSWK